MRKVESSKIQSMSGEFVKGILDKLFGRSQGANNPILSGKLIRNERYTEAYSKWQDSASKEDQLKKLSKAFEIADKGQQYEGNLQIYKTPQANGFFFNSGFTFPEEHYAFLIDHFKECLLGLDYRLYTSDTKTVENPNGIKTTERHYLKPGQIDAIEFPIDQKYGNVSIELVKLNEKTSFVKLMAGVYSDRNYADPMPFSRLVERLFEPKI